MADGKVEYEMGLNISAFRNAINGAKQGLSAFGSAGRSALAPLSGAISGTVAAMGQLNQAVELVGKLSTPVGMLARQFLDASNAAAKMEGTKVAFATLVGGAEKANQVLGQLRDLGAATPFEFPELADAGRKLIAFGESADTVAETLRVIGDISSGIQAPIGEIAEIFGKARTSGVLFAEDINQLLGRGIPIVSQFSQMLGVSADQVKKLGSDGKLTFPLLEQAFINMTSKGGMFKDMMAAQSKTMDGLKSNLSDAIGTLKQELAAPINEAIKPALADLIDWVVSLKTEAGRVGGELARWVDYIRGAFMSGNGVDSLTLPLKAGLLDAANQFSIKMSLVGAKLRTELAMGNPFTSLEEKIDAVQEIMADVGPTQGPKAGPFAKEIQETQFKIEQIQFKSALARFQDKSKDAVVDFNKGLETAVSDAFNMEKQAPGFDGAVKRAKAPGGGESAPGKSMLRVFDDIGDSIKISANQISSEGTNLADALKKTTEKIAPPRRTGAEQANDRRAENRNKLDLRRQERREETQRNNEERKKQASGLDSIPRNLDKILPWKPPQLGPDLREALNGIGKGLPEANRRVNTPQMVFEPDHKDLARKARAVPSMILRDPAKRASGEATKILDGIGKMVKALENISAA